MALLRSVFEEGNFDWVKAKEVESPKLVPEPG